MRILGVLVCSLFVSTMALGQNTNPSFKANPTHPKFPTGFKMPKDWYTKAKFAKMPKLKAGELPAKFDWREVVPGGLSPIEDQKSCGSCWAFSTAATFQDVLKITEKKTIDLSEQYLISCNHSGYSCDGGFWAFDEFVKPGAVLGKDFPYSGTNEKCKDGLKYPYQLKSWSFIGNQNPTDGYIVPAVEDLKTAIYLHGPISVAVNATDSFMSYDSGVFDNCETGGDVNHAVNLVGWDDSTGSWIMRNSWYVGGQPWGDKGYMHIKYACNQIGYGASFVEYKDIPAQASAQCTPAPKADAGSNMTVKPNKYVMLGTPSQPDSTYVWTKDGSKQTWKTSQIHVRATKTATYHLTVKTKCGDSTASVTVTVQP
jgi:C1A family cysteine protease